MTISNGGVCSARDGRVMVSFSVKDPVLLWPLGKGACLVFGLRSFSLLVMVEVSAEEAEVEPR